MRITAPPGRRGRGTPAASPPRRLVERTPRAVARALARALASLAVASLVLALLAAPASALQVWYKGIGADGKQPGERGVPDFTWTSNCFATAAYNSLYWFFLNGYPNMVPGNTSFTDDINNLWQNYMQSPACGANHGSMFSGLSQWANERGGQPFQGTYRGLQDADNSINASWLRGGAFGFPTFSFYETELRRSEDVILLVDWDDGAGGRIGHAITGAGVGPRRRVAVSDPSDEGANPPHELDPAAWQEYDLGLHGDGYLFIPNYAVAGGRDARVYGMFALSPVPEPATVVLVAVGLAALAGLARARRGA